MKERRDGAKGLLFGIVVALSLGWLGHGAVEIDMLSPAKEVGPGEFVSHVFSVANVGAVADVYALEIEVPNLWILLEAPTSLALGPGQEEILFATAIVPDGTRAGDYAMTIEVVSQSNPADRASATAPVTVRPVNEIELLPPEEESAVPGEEIRYPIEVVNRGNAQDTVEISGRSSNRFPVALSQTLLSLAPQERATIEATVSISPRTRAERDLLFIDAASTIYRGVSDSISVDTTILPPPPDVVERVLMETLPARLRFSLSKDPFDGDLASNFSFSVAGGVDASQLSISLNASPLFGPDPLELGSYAIRYRRTPIDFTVGDTSASLSPLLGLSCRGGSVKVNKEHYDFTLIAGGDDDETRAGGSLTVGPNVVNTGIAYMDRRSETAQRTAWSLSAGSIPIEGWSLRLTGGLGNNNGLTGRAVRFDTGVNTAGYFLSGSAFSIGTYFPGSGSDGAGITLSQRLRQEQFSLSLSLQHSWTNVIQNPLVPTRLKDQLGLNLSTRPFKNGPTFAATTEFTWSRREDPSLESTIKRVLSGNMSGSSGAFPYAFAVSSTDQIDHVAGTHFRTLRFSERVGLTTKDYSLSLNLDQNRKEDRITGDLLSGGSKYSLSFSPRGAIHSASVGFSNDEDRFNLSVSLGIEVFKDLRVNLSAGYGWHRDDITPPSLWLGLDFNFTFDLPIPFLITKGQVEGQIFVDQDANGHFGPGDRRVDRVVVAIEKIAASTDQEGFFRLPPLYPGKYTLNLKNLPFDAAAPEEPVVVELAAGETAIVEVPLRPVLYILGIVFNDVNQNGHQDENEAGFEEVFINLATEDGVIDETFTDRAGTFQFIDVPTGRYTLSLNPISLPERFVLTTDEIVAVDVVTDAPPVVAFGGYIKPREVVITFQPPTADFAVRPERPIAGQPATFDASDSFALFGEIESYEWDFDDDGLTDATGVNVQHVFPSPGPFDVTLTVIDDSGNPDTIMRTILVQPGMNS
jgi:hypothetical protein